MPPLLRSLTGWSCVPGIRLGCLDDRGMQTGASLVRAGDGDAGEPGGLQQVTVVRLGDRGAAAGPLLGPGELAGLGAVVGGDVADSEPPPGPQDPEGLGQDAWFVGGQV